MPIQHNVIISFNRNLSPEESRELVEAGYDLRLSIPDVLDIRCGLDIGLTGSAGLMFTLSAVFPDILYLNINFSRMAAKRLRSPTSL
mgnify:CR=1 FL=1